MAITKKGKFYYGDSQVDIKDELLRYSKLNTYPTEYYADAKCVCRSENFTLSIDDEEGAASRICINCKLEHLIGDSSKYFEDANLEECECPCGANIFEITAGIALYRNSEDVKWIYIGCPCSRCGLVACYGDWKSEYIGYQKLLENI